MSYFALAKRLRHSSVRTNPFKERLRSRDTQLGVWASLACPSASEMLSHSGLDWVVLDMEHAPNTLSSVLAQCHAMAGSPAEPIIRVPDPDDPIIVKQLLDLGVQTLLFPMVSSARQALAAVASTRYPPDGIRGVMTTSRCNGFAVDAAGLSHYYQHAAEQLCVIVQLESAEAVAQIPSIAQVAGVDAIFIGPSDLAASMGHLGNVGHPDVQQTLRGAFAACEAASVPFGCITGDVNVASDMLCRGASFVAIGTDISLLKTATQRIISKLR